MHCLFFDVKPKPGHMQHYFAHVDRLKPVLARHRGLLFLERFRPLDDPDALLSHQLWEDEEAIAAWRRDATHRRSQTAGRKIHFEGYRIRVGSQETALRDDADARNATGRYLVACYGTEPAGEGRTFESVTRPGGFVTLADAATSEEAHLMAMQARTMTFDHVRVFCISRDYTMTNRHEAPAP